MGNPVGETPTKVEWHDSLTGQQNKRVENTLTGSSSAPTKIDIVLNAMLLK